MSYENIPKNAQETAVLTRAGAAEYYILSTDPFPSPAASEAGAILEYTDLGLRFRWTGTTWVMDNSSVLIAEPYYLAVDRGRLGANRVVSVDGSNPDVDFAIPYEDLWDLGGVYSFPTANEQWEVISSNANDTAAGTGARELTLTYLDSDYIERSVSFPTNGTVAANLPVSDCFRPIDLNVTAVGSGKANAGLITLRVTGGGAGRIGILIGNNSALHGIYTVPAGHTAYLLYGYSSVGKAKEAEIKVAFTRGPNGIFTRALPIELFEGSAVYSPVAPRGPILEKTDVKLEATAFTVNSRISANVQFLLIPNT